MSYLRKASKMDQQSSSSNEQEEIEYYEVEQKEGEDGQIEEVWTKMTKEEKMKQVKKRGKKKTAKPKQNKHVSTKRKQSVKPKPKTKQVADDSSDDDDNMVVPIDKLNKMALELEAFDFTDDFQNSEERQAMLKVQEELEKKVSTLEDKVKTLEQDLEKKKLEKDVLRKNISALYRTSRQVMNLKDTRIANLQKRVDEYVLRRLVNKKTQTEKSTEDNVQEAVVSSVSSSEQRKRSSDPEDNLPLTIKVEKSAENQTEISTKASIEHKTRWDDKNRRTPDRTKSGSDNSQTLATGLPSGSESTKRDNVCSQISETKDNSQLTITVEAKSTEHDTDSSHKTNRDRKSRWDDEFGLTRERNTTISGGGHTSWNVATNWPPELGGSVWNENSESPERYVTITKITSEKQSTSSETSERMVERCGSRCSVASNFENRDGSTSPSPKSSSSDRIVEVISPRDLAIRLENKESVERDERRQFEEKQNEVKDVLSSGDLRRYLKEKEEVQQDAKRQLTENQISSHLALMIGSTSGGLATRTDSDRNEISESPERYVTITKITLEKQPTSPEISERMDEISSSRDSAANKKETREPSTSPISLNSDRRMDVISSGELRRRVEKKEERSDGDGDKSTRPKSSNSDRRVDVNSPGELRRRLEGKVEVERDSRKQVASENCSNKEDEINRRRKIVLQRVSEERAMVMTRKTISEDRDERRSSEKSKEPSRSIKVEDSKAKEPRTNDVKSRDPRIRRFDNRNQNRSREREFDNRNQNRSREREFDNKIQNRSREREQRPGSNRIDDSKVKRQRTEDLTKSRDPIIWDFQEQRRSIELGIESMRQGIFEDSRAREPRTEDLIRLRDSEIVNYRSRSREMSGEPPRRERREDPRMIAREENIFSNQRTDEGISQGWLRDHRSREREIGEERSHRSNMINERMVETSTGSLADEWRSIERMNRTEDLSRENWNRMEHIPDNTSRISVPEEIIPNRLSPEMMGEWERNQIEMDLRATEDDIQMEERKVRLIVAAREEAERYTHSLIERGLILDKEEDPAVENELAMRERELNERHLRFNADLFRDEDRECAMHREERYEERLEADGGHSRRNTRSAFNRLGDRGEEQFEEHLDLDLEQCRESRKSRSAFDRLGDRGEEMLGEECFDECNEENWNARSAFERLGIPSEEMFEKECFEEHLESAGKRRRNRRQRRKSRIAFERLGIQDEMFDEEELELEGRSAFERLGNQGDEMLEEFDDHLVESELQRMMERENRGSRSAFERLGIHPSEKDDFGKPQFRDTHSSSRDANFSRRSSDRSDEDRYRRQRSRKFSQESRRDSIERDRSPFSRRIK